MTRRGTVLVQLLLWLGCSLALAAEPAKSAAGQDNTNQGVVLDSSSSFWRVHYTLRAPVTRTGAKVEKLATALADTSQPSQEWMQAEFDDSQWARVAGKPLIPQGESYALHAGITETDGNSPALALLCVRGRFGVVDPAGVRDLKLHLSYRGGVIVYVNGAEVGRANLPKDASGPEALADDYPKEAFLKSNGSPEITLAHKYKADPEKEVMDAFAARTRTTEITIPAKTLRKGVNVLAIEIHRAPYLPAVSDWAIGKKMNFNQLNSFVWSTCGLVDLALKSASPGALTPNLTRPKGIQVWNSQPMQPDQDLDYGDPFEPLRPIKLVGTRNGVCSGKVVVGNDQPIKALKAVITDLTGAKGGGTIPAAAIKIRYAIPTGEEPIADDHYPAQADLLDGLAETPPAVVAVAAKAKGAWSFGAVCPVWVTVAVPEKAAPGDYEGKLTLIAEGLKSVDVPVQLKVCKWLAPPPSEFRTVVDLIQSPETVAMQYNVPIWSEQHFKLLEKSLERAGYVGSWTLHIPLICHANIGNEQSMIRWIKKPDGSYKYDFTVLDKYLDLAEKHMGKPRAIALIVWDVFLGFDGFDGEASGKFQHNSNLEKGAKPSDVPVSLLDEATGKITMITVGKYNEAGKANWKTLVDQLLERLKKRGLEKTIHLGHSYDFCAPDDIVTFWNDLLPGVHYFRYGHYDYPTFGKTPSGVSDFRVTLMGNLMFTLQPAYGWKKQTFSMPFIRLFSERKSGSHWHSDPHVTIPTSMFRIIGECCINSPLRGFGRMGLDYWPVQPDEKGVKNMVSIQGRYPGSSWRQTDEMIQSIVPPGPEGALSSSKLEMMREGLQETEARIFLEDVLTDPAKKAKLSAALAARAQAVLDARVHVLQHYLGAPSVAGFNSKREVYGFWHPGGMYLPRLTAIFQQWFMESGWQQRSEDLFNVAGEVAATGVK